MSTVNKDTFLPDGASEFLRRRAAELGGFALLLFSALFVAALLSYDAGDPSFNHATGKAPANWLGVPGAYLADMSLQTAGVAAALIVPLLVAWSWRLISHRGFSRSWLRFGAAPVAFVLAAAFAALIPNPAAWPLSTGLGGVAGDLLFDGLVPLAKPAGGHLVLAAVLGVLTVVAAATAVGLTWHEWRGFTVRSWRTAIRLWRAITYFSRLGEALADRLTERRAAQVRIEPQLESAPAANPIPEAPAPQAGPAPRIAKRRPRAPTGKRAAAEAQPALDLTPGEFHLPPLGLLREASRVSRADPVNEDALEQNARLLEAVLADFGVRGEITRVRPGPVVTLYELEPARGTKTSRVIGLSDDIARSMSAVSVRVAVVPGRNAIGIEMPNAHVETVLLRELLSITDYEATEFQLALVLGKDIAGAPVIADLARMPHLLVAGTTGSGKSVAVNSMILSLLFRLRPDQCRFIMIDPKMLELSVYDDIPHLLAPVVTEPSKAVVALKWTVREMEHRYREMSRLGVRNITSYNQRLAQSAKKGEVLKRTVQTGFDEDTAAPIFEEQILDLLPLPHIVVVVDEMADLMLIAGKDIEASVQRLSQMARAAGIHLIMATQRPSVDVITGTIKANFPTRISFQVTSKIDSRTILGEAGAEQLLGSGDMLLMQSGGRLMRVHGPFVTEEEVERVVDYLRDQGAPEYLDVVTEEEEQVAPTAESSSGDVLYDQAVDLICREGKASTSFIQRHLQIGYNRAARIIERMEADGVVSPANHVGKREVLARRLGEFE
jgi:S-DNA-T family DNA segregation ATPase FtsK/SpoIIIE